MQDYIRDYLANVKYRLAQRWTFFVPLLCCAIGGSVLVWQSGDATAARWGTIATLLSAVASFGLVWLAYQNIFQVRQIVEETRIARIEHSRPKVIVYFERDKDLYVVIENFGGGPAVNVRFSFEPPLTNHLGERIDRKPPFSTDIPMMRPRYKQRLLFASFAEYQEEWYRCNSPASGKFISSKFLVHISFFDPLENYRKYREEYVLDVHHLMDYQRLPRHDAGKSSVITLDEEDGVLIVHRDQDMIDDD